MRRILVTGGTSYIGAPLVLQLARDHDVRVLARTTGGSHFRVPLRDTVYFCPGDIRDRHEVARAVHGCDSVIHLAYAPVTAEPREIIDTAVLGMANVLRACAIHHVTDLMLVTSPRAANRDCYGAGKLASELMVQAYMTDEVLRRAVIARVFNAYGPDMGVDHVIPQFIGRMCELEQMDDGPVIPFPITGSGLDRRSFIHIDDCTRQLMTLFSSAVAGSYDVGSPGPVMTITELAHAIADCFGRKIRVQPGPVRTVAELAHTVLPHPPPMLAELPAADFTEGLIKTVAWYRARQEVFIAGSL